MFFQIQGAHVTLSPGGQVELLGQEGTANLPLTQPVPGFQMMEQVMQKSVVEEHLVVEGSLHGC
jgi:hypothetical protein